MVKLSSSREALFADFLSNYKSISVEHPERLWASVKRFPLRFKAMTERKHTYIRCGNEAHKRHEPVCEASWCRRPSLQVLLE